jgi:hypothetical protein
VRYGVREGVWVETGTFKGKTTRRLARHAKQVYSIEPSEALATQARAKLSKFSNVEIITGTSEEVMPNLVARLEGAVSFFLDGHYSAGETFRGQTDTPIEAELAAIEAHIHSWKRCVVLIDDVRCFDPDSAEYGTYPERSSLVAFADRNSMKWTIEHDIFCAWVDKSLSRGPSQAT